MTSKEEDRYPEGVPKQEEKQDYPMEYQGRLECTWK